MTWNPILPAGPGARTAAADDAVLDFIALPRGMETYRPPTLPEPELLGALGPGLALLQRLKAALDSGRDVGQFVVLDLSTLDRPNRALLEQTLGAGEVTGTLSGRGQFAISETRLAGVWWVRGQDPGHGRDLDYLEVADLPGLVRTMAFDGATERLRLPDPLPPGVMNAPGVVAEVNAWTLLWQPGKPTHVVNLSLLPITPPDLELLDATLGQGGASLLSRGYGTCRVDSTGLLNCWRVRHFNSEDRLILDSIEVTDAPVAVLAAPEDLADSATRLAEILSVLECG